MLRLDLYEEQPYFHCERVEATIYAMRVLLRLAGERKHTS